MAVDVNEELKKAANKTNVYKTYKEYKKGYDDLKKKAGSSQEKSKSENDKYIEGRNTRTFSNFP